MKQDKPDAQSPVPRPRNIYDYNSVRLRRERRQEIINGDDIFLNVLCGVMNMSWSTMKKLFGRKKNRTAQGGRPNDDDDDDRSGRLKNLEVFRPLPGEIARHVDSIKSTLTEMSDCRAQSHNQQFVGKLNDLLDFLDQNALLREYVNHVYSK